MGNEDWANKTYGEKLSIHGFSRQMLNELDQLKAENERGTYWHRVWDFVHTSLIGIEPSALSNNQRAWLDRILWQLKRSINE